MKQLYIFVFQNLLVTVCGLIDTAFSNSINLDSICVLSSYTVITWVTYKLYSLGSYGYRVLQDKAKLCLYLQMTLSVVVGFLVFSLSEFIPHIYSLTPEQYVLFSKCLRVHAISVPALALGEFMDRYMMLKCKNKQILVANIIFYAIMIALDAIVVYLGKDLSFILLATLVSYLVYDVYVLVASGILHEELKFSFKDIGNIMQHGCPILFDRLSGKVATIAYNALASSLGTELYAIHSVCYTLTTASEGTTGALYTYQTVDLIKKEPGLSRFNRCITTMKTQGFKLVLITYLISFVLLLFTHGDVPLSHCWIWLILYVSQSIALVFYESFSGYLTTEKQTAYLSFGGVCGILTRIPIALAGYYFNLGLFPFAIACVIDYGIRSLYFYLCSVKARDRIEGSTTVEADSPAELPTIT